MSTKNQRTAAITRAIDDIKLELKDGVTVDSMNAAKAVMLYLASKQSLFTYEDFPTPDEKQIERTDLIYEDDDGTYGLYVNSSRPGQKSRPHDHGGSWAIIAAVHGEEEHRLYEPSEDGDTLVKEKAMITVKPGTAVSLLPNGIHAIHAASDRPLMHLHLYGKSFRNQGERKEYDLENGVVREFVLEDLGFIEDKR